MGRSCFLCKRDKASSHSVYQDRNNLSLGNPRKIIIDNGSNLNNKMIKELYEGFKIKNHNSSPYSPKMNCAVEAANKKIIQKMVKTCKD